MVHCTGGAQTKVLHFVNNNCKVIKDNMFPIPPLFHTLLYDLIYNPDETLFMQKGRLNGATVKNGLEMLLLQAFATWDFWNDKE